MKWNRKEINIFDNYVDDERVLCTPLWSATVAQGLKGRRLLRISFKSSTMRVIIIIINEHCIRRTKDTEIADPISQQALDFSSADVPLYNPDGRADTYLSTSRRMTSQWLERQLPRTHNHFMRYVDCATYLMAFSCPAVQAVLCRWWQRRHSHPTQRR